MDEIVPFSIAQKKGDPIVFAADEFINRKSTADVLAGLREAGLSTPLIIGGIIPDVDAQAMLAMGVAAIYTPKDFDLNRIMFDIVGLAEGKAEAA